MARLLIAVIVFVVLIALAPAAPVPKGTDKTSLFFPTKVGVEWVYAEQDGDATLRVTAVEDKDGAKVVSGGVGGASVRDQCAAAGVAFFHKQNGGLRSKSGGRDLDGVVHGDMPAVSSAPVATAADRKRLVQFVEGRTSNDADRFSRAVV
jgi:hypothetical protein